jgi:NADH-quinone oxidoreductase subunit L
MNFADPIWLIPALPLLGFLLNLFFIKNERTAGLIASGAVGAAFIVALAMFVRILGIESHDGVEAHYPDVNLWNWITVGTFNVPFGLMFDPLTGVMTLLVTGVGTLIHVYSIGYMHHDARAVRYFAYLNLFVVMMLLLVMANNYLLLFLGWEGVGLCSFLLIGHWFERKVAQEASVKAFVVNRIGDAGFLLAIFIIWTTFGTLNFYTQNVGGQEVLGLLERAEEIAGQTVNVGVLGPWLLASVIAFLMLVAVSGKSAQVPLFVWLPDAMAGPTPVSALIHAATMVTAGVYLIVRSHTFFELSPNVSNLTAWIGALTALIGGLAAVAQWDIKRVLAFSTVSQLGFMVAAAGMGAYVPAMFHLLTHGVFKALLFLGSGSVIHGTHDTQDMRKMGGLRTHMPTTYWTYLVGTLALAGIFPLAGFWSKDEIIASAWGTQRFAIFIMLVATSMLTAFYMGRQIALVFFGKQRDTSYHAHESGRVMTLPLIVLAVGAIIAGAINLPKFAEGMPGAHALGHVLEPVLHEEALPFGLTQIVIALVVMLLAAGAGYLGFSYYNRQSKSIKIGGKDPLYRATGDLWDLAAGAVGFDALAEYVKKGYVWLCRRLADFDARGLDGLVDAIGAAFVGAGGLLRRGQTGYVRNYALVFLIGVLLMIGYFAFAGAGAAALGLR